MSYKIEDFKLGDRVRFRSWDDMAEEYGSEHDIIYCKYEFIPAMKHLCGTEATIKEIYEFDIGGVELTDFETNGCTSFSFSVDMIEPIDAGSPLEFDEEQFLSMLG